MIARVLFLFIGLVAAGAGGFLAWINRDLAGALFPPDPVHSPWPLVGAVALIASGLVSVGAGLKRPKTTQRAADAKSAEQAAALQAADAYYATKSPAPAPDHPADRDWRSADLPAAPSPVAMPPPLRAAPPAVAPAPAPLSVTPAMAPEAPRQAAPLTMPSPLAFPAEAKLAPVPPAGNPSSAAPPARPPSVAPAVEEAPLGRIRAALAANQLEVADRLLAEERSRLSGAGDADPLALATLTGLAGDHAAADGRVGGAKWLWRLALQRFAKADAMTSVEARAVAERLRLADE